MDDVRQRPSPAVARRAVPSHASAGDQTPVDATVKERRYDANRAAKSRENAEHSERRSKTALLLGGGAPNMALMAGTVLAFHERGARFDVVSTSGAGAVVALLWLAPKGKPAADALRNIVNLSVSDAIYRRFPVNYKIFNKPGTMAGWYRQWLAGLPGAAQLLDQSLQSPAQRLFSDWMQFWWACCCPSNLTSFSQGLCAPLPFVDGIVDFDAVKRIEPYFYVNAYNIDREMLDDFPKEVVTADHLRAALAFPLVYGPFKLGEHRYYEGAVVDCLNYKDLVEKHTGLETIVVLDVLGAPSLIRPPRDLYDSWVLSMIIPLVETAKDDTELFALKHNGGWLRRDGAKSDLLKVAYDIPRADLDEVLDWSASNARRLFDIGYMAGLKFCDEHAAALGLAAPARTRAAAKAIGQQIRRARPKRRARRGRG
jgi:predicted acylesterase/phospholipase RssA